ncbi:unnamed protein product [Phytophthora fragariaefolia]|uniref:Unnamed protein product n=1 Tax=Phytophthora fragariaefolia TaxID=1490495 RepID=A0A9W7DA90_9STRA|nr:unnamed protein product [Phytophthora fragariaefolia]
MRKTLGAWAFSDFLDREPQVTVAGNWKRHQELFGHFADGTTPPAGWITNIHVVAIDQPQCVCGDYAAERKKANGGDSASKLVPPLRKTVDLTGGNAGSSKSKAKQSASTGKSTSKGRRKKLSWDEFLKKLQLRPSNYRPSPQLALPASSKLARFEDEAREALPGPQVWRKLRHDLHYVMRNGFTYEDAKELVSGEHVVHPFIHHEPLVAMLVSIIRSDGLDAVPWTSFVPEMYYLRAEVRLESMFDRGEKPEPWFLLDEEYVQDGLEPLSSSSSGDSEYEQEDDVAELSDSRPTSPSHPRVHGSRARRIKAAS